MEPIIKTKNIWRTLQIAGIALVIPFELAIGPFIGYLIGLYLKNKFGMHIYVMYILILMGSIASIFNTVEIIRTMIRINKEK